MVIKLSLLLLTVCILASAQQFSPKEPGYIPFNDLYSVNIARSGWNNFWKVDANGWGVVISEYPVRPNAVTKVTFYLQIGNTFLIGCGKKNIE